MIDAKRCIYCKEVKPLAEFNKAPRRRDGRTSNCLKCLRERHASYRKTDAYKEYMRRYSKKRYLASKPRQLAMSKVRYAVSKGTLVKPYACERCHRNLPLEGHHEDYDKVLEVKWLCNICHKFTHKRITDLSLVPAAA